MMTRGGMRKMKTVYFQLAAVLFLVIIIVFLYFYLRKEDGEEKMGKDIWTLRCQRIEPTSGIRLSRMLLFRRYLDEASLPEGSFYLGGNVLLDDIVLNTKKSIRLYLNVMPDKVLLTVLKGRVKINGYVYYKDQNRQIIIRDHMEVFANEAKLIFRKGR